MNFEQRIDHIRNTDPLVIHTLLEEYRHLMAAQNERILDLTNEIRILKEENLRLKEGE